MTQKRKNEILSKMLEFITELAEDDSSPEVAIESLSENPYIRAGHGERGKILIDKADLPAYFKKSA